MIKSDACEKLDLLIKSSQPIITCETVEEDRLHRLVRSVAFNLTLPYYEWSITEGFRLNAQINVPNTTEPIDCLNFIRKLGKPAVFLLNDFFPHMQTPTMIRLLREVAETLVNSSASILLCAPEIKLPAEISDISMPFVLKMPSEEEIRALATSILDNLARSKKFSFEINSDEMNTLIQTLSGLTLRQARQLLTYAAIEHNAFTAKEIASIVQRKAALIENNGLLEIYPPNGKKTSLGGFAELKKWLATAQTAFTPEARLLNLASPKGILLVGVPGCGKSLCAKMIASEWQQTLVRMDASRLFDKFIGESEKNFRKATQIAESIAPCILWIDEIEKSFSNSQDNSAGDGGLSQRLFGSFLTWMQEKNQEVFLVATANKIDSLPLELLRKGRFDEVFFVDLPSESERAEIFKAQFALHNLNANEFDIAKLSQCTAGYSGAEIEQLINVSLLKNLREHKKPNSDSIELEAQSLIPLSHSRPEDLENMRAQAKGRFRSAS